MNIDSLVAAFNEHQRKVRLGLVALFAVLCLYFLFLIIKTVLFPGPAVFAEIHLAKQSATNVRWNWYATSSQDVQQEEEEQEELAVASINAELLGVVIAGEDSIATIAVSRKAAEIYQIGDEIESNVTLEEVESNRVIISQAGARRQLLLKDITGSTTANTEETQLIRVNETPAASGGGFTLPGVGATTPIQVPGEGMGLRLSQVSADIADLADLENGDVVMEINGTPVADLFTNPLLWQQFSQQTSLPMTVIRGGEREEVYVNASSLFEKIIPQLGAGLIQ